MLLKLVISNYAIIDHLALEPDRHLNIVTGETGAGKSIILGALSLILGGRADTSVLIDKEQKCVVEGHFQVAANKPFQKALSQADIDPEDVCIIRREISPSGKSRAFVNDTPVTLQVLGQLSGLLVDIHQQFDQLIVGNDDFQLEVVDAMAQNAAALQSYQASFTRYTQVSQQLSALEEEEDRARQQGDYRQFLLDELDEAGFRDNEVEEAGAALKQWQHQEKIEATLGAARQLLDAPELPMLTEMRKLVGQFQQIAPLFPQAQPVAERLGSSFEELKDILSEIERLTDQIHSDPAEQSRLQERLDLGYRLFKKHAVQDTAGLLAIRDQLSRGREQDGQRQERIAQLEQQKQEQADAIARAGETLTRNRTKVIPGLVKEINSWLKEVGMPNAAIQIELTALAKPSAQGLDKLQFLLDANRSGRWLPVYKAASGGELSRIMLIIKSLTAKAMKLPTLVFDEVDTGISGEAARKVGTLLRSLAEYHQVICITHQPQVAARATRHFYVYKQAGTNLQVRTGVRTLRDDERVLSIARMIGGEQPSEAALQHARELVH